MGHLVEHLLIEPLGRFIFSLALQRTAFEIEGLRIVRIFLLDDLEFAQKCIHIAFSLEGAAEKNVVFGNLGDAVVDFSEQGDRLDFPVGFQVDARQEASHDRSLVEALEFSLGPFVMAEQGEAHGMFLVVVAIRLGQLLANESVEFVP